MCLRHFRGSRSQSLSSWLTRSSAPSRRAGATVRKRWTWLPTCRRPSGVPTARNGRARLISPPSARATRREACPRSLFTACDVQQIGDTVISDDVRGKILGFVGGLRPEFLRYHHGGKHQLLNETDHFPPLPLQIYHKKDHIIDIDGHQQYRILIM